MPDVDEIRALKRELACALKRRVEDVPAIEKRLAQLGDPVADAAPVEKRAPGRPKKPKAE